MRISDGSSDVCSSDLLPAGDFIALFEIEKNVAATVGAAGGICGLTNSDASIVRQAVAYQIGGQFLFDQLCTVGPEGYEPTLEAIAEQAVVDDEAAIVRGLSIRGTLEPSRCDNFIAVKQGPGTMAFVAVRSEEHTSELQSLMRI